MLAAAVGAAVGPAVGVAVGALVCTSGQPSWYMFCSMVALRAAAARALFSHVCSMVPVGSIWIMMWVL